MEAKTAIEHYEIFSEEYDKLSRKHGWYPEILFGLVFEYLKKGEKLLDLGIGTGQSSIPFKKIGLKIHGLDGSKKMLEKCESRKIADELKEFDLNKIPLPYKNNSFNHIISNGVFYFIKDLDNIFSDVRRILKKRGTFSFTVEDLKKGRTKKYVNRDNDLISERIADKTGVKVYRHSKNYILGLIKNYKFRLLKELEYFAYNSPTEKRDIYFRVYILKKV